MSYKLIWRTCVSIFAMQIFFMTATPSLAAEAPAENRCVKVVGLTDNVFRSRLGNDSDSFPSMHLVQEYSCLSDSVRIVVAMPRSFGYFVADPIPVIILCRSKNFTGELDARVQSADSAMEIYRSAISKNAWNKSEVRYSQLSFVLQSFSPHSSQSHTLLVGYTAGGVSQVMRLSGIELKQSMLLSKTESPLALPNWPAHRVDDNALLCLILFVALGLTFLWPFKAVAERRPPVTPLSRRLNRWLEIASVRNLTEKESHIFTNLLCRILAIASLDQLSLQERLKDAPELYSGAEAIVERCREIVNSKTQPDPKFIALLQRDLEDFLNRLQTGS